MTGFEPVRSSVNFTEPAKSQFVPELDAAPNRPLWHIPKFESLTLKARPLERRVRQQDANTIEEHF